MWAWFASTKAGRLLIGLGAVLAAIVAALGIGWLKGRKSQADADKGKDAQISVQAAQEVVNAAVVRQEVQRETDALPEAKPQRVLDADRASAAGKLAAEWLRSPSTPAADPGKADPAN
jgi:hypothetical protein